VKKLLPLLLLATLGMLAALPHIAAADDQGDQGLNGAHHQTDHEIGHENLAEFHIRLAGDQQIPPVNTTAFGFAEVRLFQNGTSTAIEFRVVVCNIANVTLVHIHVGDQWSPRRPVLRNFQPSLKHTWVHRLGTRCAWSGRFDPASRCWNRELD